MLKRIELLDVPATPAQGLIRRAQAQRRRHAHDVVRYARKTAQAVVDGANEAARAANERAYLDGFTAGLAQSLAVCAMQMADEARILQALRPMLREQLAQWLGDALDHPAFAALLEKEIIGDTQAPAPRTLDIHVPKPLQSLGAALCERLAARGYTANVQPSPDGDRMLVCAGDRVWTLALQPTAVAWAGQVLAERAAPLKLDSAARHLAAQAAARVEAELKALALFGARARAAAGADLDAGADPDTDPLPVSLAVQPDTPAPGNDAATSPSSS